VAVETFGIELDGRYNMPSLPLLCYHLQTATERFSPIQLASTILPRTDKHCYAIKHLQRAAKQSDGSGSTTGTLPTASFTDTAYD
jgi:hypothetical protein